MFDPHVSGHFVAAIKRPAWNGVCAMSIFKYRWVAVIWVIVGLVIAWTHSYITVGVLKIVLSALLSVFLWPLVLLGVSLHVH
jgi:hypothetical protein